MKNFSRVLFVGSVLSVFGCASPEVIRYSMLEVPAGKAVFDEPLYSMVEVSNVKYHLPYECVSSHVLNGQTEKRVYSGAAEGRYFDAKLEQRTFVGGIEARFAGAQTEKRVFNGANELRRHQVEAEARTVDAGVEQRRYELQSENRNFVGQVSKLYCIPGELRSDVSIVNENWINITRFEFVDG